MKVVCEHCGLPFSVPRVVPGRPVYCCSGCALAARVPVDAQGQFPVNATLVAALGVGFVFFNQILFWLLASLLAREPERAGNAALFAGASLGVGMLTCGLLLYLQGKAGARSWTDLGATIVAAAMLAAAAARFSPGLAAATNAALALWALRGLRRQKRSQGK